jgi:LPS-assembly protein
MNKFSITALVLILLFSSLISANTQDNTYINTSNIAYDEKNNIVELYENSKININSTNILIDRGIIDYENNELEVFGNFYLYQGVNILSGKDLIGDTDLNKFTAYDVDYIYNNDLKVDAESAIRINDSMTFFNNFLTPCEIDGYFNCPTWSLRIDKTEYSIEKDKFVHFDSFLQIADYKIFYLPYFSHYGVKAPRQKGFLTPTLEFVIGGNSGLKVPYYLPIKENIDITITPTILFDNNFEFLEEYKFDTSINVISSGGNTNIELVNIKKENNENINNTIRFDTKQVLNKTKILSAKGVFTNSISTTRSENDESITFEDIYLRLENYNFLDKDGYLKSEIATIESFDATDLNSIPISPRIEYHNSYLINNNQKITSELSYRILNRDDSTAINPSQNYIFNFNSNIDRVFLSSSFKNYNKVSSINSFREYNFEHDESLNRKDSRLDFIFSSDFYFDYYKSTTPRVKIIYPLNILKSDQVINEDSQSLGFNYYNQFSDNRLYGNDLIDNTPRLVYGLENNLNLASQKIKFRINQSYDFKKNNLFANKVNQKRNFSDISLEFNTNYRNVNFKTDIRLDEDDLTKKELNYYLDLESIFDFSLNYNETSKESYVDRSNNSKDLGIKISKKLNDNLKVSYSSKMDLKNEFSPYKSSLSINIFDECSDLSIEYSDSRFNDNFNTQPEQKISFTFSMDYLGFFGYEQSTNLFFEEPGNFNYGL